MSFRQALALSWASILGMRSRAVPSAIAIVGFAGVAIMLVILLSGRDAIRAIYEGAGRDDVALVRAGEASYEGVSPILPPIALEVERMPGIARDERGPMMSKELVRITGARLTPAGASRVGVAVTARGVTPRAFELRPRLRIIEGRRFSSGKFEAIAGRALQEQFGVRVGSEIKVEKATLQVVGLFESEGGVAEMEVWVDKPVLENLVSTAGNGQAIEQISSLWVKLTGSAALHDLNAAISRSSTALMKSFGIRAVSERAFLRAQSKALIERASKVALAVGLVMGAGALFGAINTMYAAVAYRSRELATLRALGFQSMPVAGSVISEALLLSLVGGLIGVVIALVCTHNIAFAMYNSGAGSNIAVRFLPTPTTVLIALGYVLLLGVVSSILPCLRALRRPIPASLFAH